MIAFVECSIESYSSAFLKPVIEVLSVRKGAEALVVRLSAVELEYKRAIFYSRQISTSILIRVVPL